MVGGGNNGGEWTRTEREGIRRIALRPCSIKGEITHLLRFFLKTTALIDQTGWMYRPISSMKYRHEKSITPVFPLSPVRQCATGSSSSRLMHLRWVCRPTTASPAIWIFGRLPLTRTSCYLPGHVPDKWRSRSYSIII